MSSSPTSLDGIKRLEALYMTNSETLAKDKNSDCERKGKEGEYPWTRGNID
jgi:hypothetical protein